MTRSTWIRSRIERTSGSLDLAFREGLTGHVVRSRDGKTVELVDGTVATEFVSCSYLGLEHHDVLVDAAAQALRTLGLHISTSRNRMRPHHLDDLESLLGEVLGGAPTLVFTSVSSVHLGVLPVLGANALPGHPIRDGGPSFLVERTAHASMQVLRGVLEQLGPVGRFDVADLDAVRDTARRERDAGRTPILLVDGVGSMGGLIDLVALHGIADETGGVLYVDDAHGVSVLGERGAGYALEELGGTLPHNVVLAGSLSKAFGGAGGFVATADPADLAVLRRSANPLVFGHSIPLPTLAANVASARLHLDGTVRAEQDRLWSAAGALDAATGYGLMNAGLSSPVRGLVLPTETETLDLARALRRNGILVLPVFYPTVSAGTGPIRVALSSRHRPDQIRSLAAVLRPWIPSTARPAGPTRHTERSENHEPVLS